MEDGPQSAYPDAQDGRNNFGGGSNLVDGVPWSLLSTTELASMYSEMQGYLTQYGLGAGVNLTLGQERKIRRDAAAIGTSSDGELILRSMAAGAHCPVATSYISSWPPNDPYRRVSRMLDLQRDLVYPDGSYSASDTFERYVNLGLRTGSWINLLCHAVYPDGTPGRLTSSQLFTLFDYLTAPGRFDGTTGQIISISQALALS